MLAAVLAIAVAFAGAVVLFDMNQSDAADPLTEMPGSVTEDCTVNLTSTVENARYSYSATEAVNITVTMSAISHGTVMFENCTFEVGENVTLILKMTHTGIYNFNVCHILMDCNVTINGGTVKFIQESGASGQTWWDSADDEDDVLIMNGGVLDFAGANGMSGIDGDLNGNAVVKVSTETTSSAAAISFRALEMESGASIDLNAGSNVSEKTYLNIEQSASIAGTIDTGKSTKGVNIGANADVTLTGKITALNIALNNGSTLDSTNGEIAGTDSAKLTINVIEGSTFKQGALTNAAVTGHGTVETPGDLGLTNVLDQDLEIVSNMYLTQNLEIPEGITLTIKNKGTLNLAGYNITVYGEIVVEKGGVIESPSDDSSITLKSTGKFTSNGTVGNMHAVKIINGATEEDAAEESVSIQNVNGITIELKRVSGENYYKMNISGSVGKVSGKTVCVLGATNVNINGDLTIEKGVTFDADRVTVAKGVGITVNGTMTGDLELDNGSTFVANGSVTGAIKGIAGQVSDTTGNVEGDSGTTVTFTGNEKGVTLSVGRVSETVDGVTKTYQRMYITGGLTAIDEKNDAGITIAGTIFVKDTLTVYKSAGLAMGVDGLIDVSAAGTVQVNDRGDSGNNVTITYSGAKYIVESDDKTSETVYYTSFDSAYAMIGSAYGNTIYVSGSYTISGTYEIAADQMIESEGEVGLTISETGSMTIDADGEVSSDVFDKIEGIVYVAEGIGYEPDNGTEYAVSSEDDDGNMTYSGFKVAIDNAADGAVIDVVGNATYNGSLTIGKNLTINIADGKYLRVTGNLTIEEGAKLVLGQGSQIIAGTVGKESSINVYGTLDAADGKVYSASKNTADEGEEADYASATVNLYSTGTTMAGAGGDAISSAAATGENNGPVSVNAAYYNDDGYVYTSVAKAVAYCEDNSGYPISITVTGTVTEKDAITSNDIDIVIANGAKVTLGDVTLVKASIYSAASEEEADQGVYTANVSGLTGTGDVAVLSTVSVTETTATIANKVTVNAQGANVCETTIDKVAGKSTAVTAGKIVFVGEKIETSDDVTTPVKLSVSSGAELVIGEKDDAISVSGEISNAGTITVAGDVTIDADAEIGGSVAVADEASLTVSDGETLVITGTLTVSGTEDKEGTLTVNGILQVGETPEYLGASGSVSGKVIVKGMIVVFDGASVADATLVDDQGQASKSTSYTINGIAFATIYGNGDVGDINGYVYALKDVVSYDDKNDNDTIDDDESLIKWYSGETLVANTISIGTYASVSTELEYAGVSIEISVMPRITLSVDGIVWDGLTNPKVLSIGTHTVSVTPYPGYSGDITVTFNGQTVTDGKIVITADMIGEKAPLLSVTGNIVVDNGTVTSSGDDGLGLTDYLLIILVVLIAIMAIIVALRLTRS